MLLYLQSELAHRDGDNTLMETVFDLYLSYLKSNPSEALQKHVFAVWRNFVRKVSDAVLKSKG